MLRFTLRHLPGVVSLFAASVAGFLSHDYATGFLALAALLIYGEYVNGPCWRHFRDDEAKDAHERAEEEKLDEEYARERAVSDAQHALLMDAYTRECEAWDASGAGGVEA